MGEVEIHIEATSPATPGSHSVFESDILNYYDTQLHAIENCERTFQRVDREIH